MCFTAQEAIDRRCQAERCTPPSRASTPHLRMCLQLHRVCERSSSHCCCRLVFSLRQVAASFTQMTELILPSHANHMGGYTRQNATQRCTLPPPSALLLLQITQSSCCCNHASNRVVVQATRLVDRRWHGWNRADSVSACCLSSHEDVGFCLRSSQSVSLVLSL